MEKRKLGKSGVVVSPMGLGCWAIGAPFEFDGRPAGRGEVDDVESVRAIPLALELRVNFFDTADVYGCGRSERMLGQALEDRRDEAVVATKVGLLFDKDTKQAGAPWPSRRSPSRSVGVRATGASERKGGSRRGSAWTTVFGNGRRRAGIDSTADTTQSATRRNGGQPPAK